MKKMFLGLLDAGLFERSFCREITAHAMHSWTRRRRGRTKKSPGQRRAVKAGCGTQKELAQERRATGDVSAYKIRVVPLQFYWPHHGAAGDAVAEAGSKSLHLILNPAHDFRRVSVVPVRHMAIAPSGMLSRRRARRVKQTGLGKQHEWTLRDLSIPWETL